MNILLDGKFFNGSGFAEENRVLLKTLREVGCNVQVHLRDKMIKKNVLHPDEIKYISSSVNNKLPTKDIYICNMQGARVHYNPNFRINIARTTFETDRIPMSWVPKLNQFSEIWVPSTFNKATFSASGVKVPIKLIPNLMNSSQYLPNGKAFPLQLSERFSFLSVFDLQDRKGYDILIRAFLNEFSREENVALVLKTRRKDKKLDHLISIHSKPKDNNPLIQIIDYMLTSEKLLSLYRTCDTFVLPSRGEGWGRPYFEAMLMEMPVIGTNWSGQTDFMNNSNSFLIKVKRLERIDNADYKRFNGHFWAEPSLADLKHKMRYVYEHQKEAKRIGKQAREDLLERFSYHKISRTIINELSKFD